MTMYYQGSQKSHGHWISKSGNTDFKNRR